MDVRRDQADLGAGITQFHRHSSRGRQLPSGCQEDVRSLAQRLRVVWHRIGSMAGLLPKHRRRKPVAFGDGRAECSAMIYERIAGHVEVRPAVRVMFPLRQKTTVATEIKGFPIEMRDL